MRTAQVVDLHWLATGGLPSAFIPTAPVFTWCSASSTGLPGRATGADVPIRVLTRPDAPPRRLSTLTFTRAPVRPVVVVADLAQGDPTDLGLPVGLGLEGPPVVKVTATATGEGGAVRVQNAVVEEVGFREVKVHVQWPWAATGPVSEGPDAPLGSPRIPWAKRRVSPVNEDEEQGLRMLLIQT